MPKYYPAMLDIRGRSVIVIGGDTVAAEKAEALAACGAYVYVQSPDFCSKLVGLAEQKRITLFRKAYEHGDLSGAFVVVAATNDPQLARAIWEEAQEHRQLVNIVDKPEYCTFILPSILRRGQLAIAVSTEGASPGLAKRIRHSLEDIFPPAYDTYVRLAAVARTYLREQDVTYDVRDNFFGDFFVSDVLKWLVDGDRKQAAAITTSLLRKYGIEISTGELAAALEGEEEYVTHTA